MFHRQLYLEEFLAGAWLHALGLAAINNGERYAARHIQGRSIILTLLGKIAVIC